MKETVAEDVRLDPLLALMEDGPDREVVFEIFESLLNFGQLNIQAPERGRVFGDPAAADPDVLHHAPIAVLLAVFEASFAAHEHVQSVRCFASQIKGVGRHYTPFWRSEARKSATFRAGKSSN